jgi:3-phosphoshikimate 1-carboxyvinyltransferase
MRQLVAGKERWIMIQIATRPLRQEAVIRVPGSKSYTHRLLIAAALSDGRCRIGNPLRSDDIRFTLRARADGYPGQG